jgi:hypothetical protein
VRPSRLAVAALLLGALACRSGRATTVAPEAPALPPEFVRSYLGQRLILRHHGAAQRVSLTRAALAQPSGNCDVGVEVRQASLENGTLSFTLEALGVARVEGQPAGAASRGPCGTVSAFVMTVAGFAADEAAEVVRGELGKVLATPEAYLAAHGVPFDRPPGAEPREAASRERDATPEERGLARQVTSWPRVLLRVDPAYRDPSGRVRHEGELEFVAVVGLDGRISSPKLRTPLASAHEEHVIRTLSLWRFEPAQRTEGPLAARILGRLTFRVY